jgi:hypothetical protein
MEGFTLACLGMIGRVLDDEVIAEYFARLPAPTCNLARYTDWVLPYLEKQADEARKFAGTGTDEKLKTMATVTSLFEAHTPRLAAISLTPPYVITRATAEQVVSQTVFDSTVELTVTQISGTFVESKPTGDSNLSTN